MGSKMSKSPTMLFGKLWYDFYKDLWNVSSCRGLFPNRFLSSFLQLFLRFRWNLNVFWDHFSLRCGLLLEKSLRCGDASSDACDALETAWHFCCDLGSAMRSCDAHRAICDARCEIAKQKRSPKSSKRGSHQKFKIPKLVCRSPLAHFEADPSPSRNLWPR